MKMKRQIVLYIAMSLDGYIARKNGALDWLPEPTTDQGYENFYKTIDTVVMGKTTYEQVNMSYRWINGHMKVSDVMLLRLK